MTISSLFRFTYMISPSKKLLDMYVIEDCIIANDETISVGDAVIINTSAPNTIVGAAGTTGIILGTVVAIKNGAAAGNVFLQESTITAAADNETVAQVSVDVLPSDDVTTYVADLDAVAGTTTNSQFKGYFNLSGTVNGQLDESSYSASSEEQFLSYGVNPGNQSQVIGVWTKIAQA